MCIFVAWTIYIIIMLISVIQLEYRTVVRPPMCGHTFVFNTLHFHYASRHGATKAASATFLIRPTNVQLSYQSCLSALLLPFYLQAVLMQVCSKPLIITTCTCLESYVKSWAINNGATHGFKEAVYPLASYNSRKPILDTSLRNLLYRLNCLTWKPMCEGSIPKPREQRD